MASKMQSNDRTPRDQTTRNQSPGWVALYTRESCRILVRAALVQHSSSSWMMLTDQTWLVVSTAEPPKGWCAAAEYRQLASSRQIFTTHANARSNNNAMTVKRGVWSRGGFTHASRTFNHLLEHLVFALGLQLQPVAVIPNQKEAEWNLPCCAQKWPGQWRQGAGISACVLP